MQSTAPEAPSRQIVLDTETTGLEARQGHRIIEIGCVELVNRRLTGNNFHIYLNPHRKIDDGAIAVHGITNEFLIDKPDFSDIAEKFLSYVSGAELVIHNAPFDVGFLNAELEKLDYATPKIDEICSVHDTLVRARKMFPGQRNDLGGLCKRYEVNNDQRELHGALLDAEILADVFLFMTGGQTMLTLDAAQKQGLDELGNAEVDFAKLDLLVQSADQDELELHAAWVEKLNEQVEGESIFAKLDIGEKLH